MSNKNLIALWVRRFLLEHIVADLNLSRNTQASYRDAMTLLLPFAAKSRFLFKMDFAEVVYISELRTGPAGHFSYRNVAYAMYEAVAKKYPALAKYLRVHDVKEPVDLLKR